MKIQAMGNLSFGKCQSERGAEGLRESNMPPMFGDKREFRGVKEKITYSSMREYQLDRLESTRNLGQNFPHKSTDLQITVLQRRSLIERFE